jgi:predicted CoA-binding protein
MYSDDLLRSVLSKTKVIAMVGVSPNPVRPSNYVGRYMTLKGFKVHPINPQVAGDTLWGATVLNGLAGAPAEIDMVDIFRRSEFVPDIVDEALVHLPNLKTIWMQIGVTHAEAAARAEAKGITVIQNRCPKIEYQRLFGELRMGGFATGIISSKL